MPTPAPKALIRLEDGSEATALEPVLVSASRSTDIPAFYCDWFFHRLLRVGYSVWINPFNGVRSYVSYAKTRFIVFWSKNPRPLLARLDELRQRGVGCYVQYTLNDYEDEGFERGVPRLGERVDTFRRLSAALGRDGVVWRFDPLMLTDRIGEEELLRKVESLGDQLAGLTEKLVFSFADLSPYRKVRANLAAAGVEAREWTEAQMAQMAARLVELNERKGWGLTLATCGERGDYLGVVHNSCVDDALIIRRASHDRELMRFLRAEVRPMPQPDLFGRVEPLPPGAIVLGDGTFAIRGNNRDTGQRELCGCAKSKDIGQYDTCPHQCVYCYANTSERAAMANFERHLEAPWGETITGR